jgi:hypothetical protein
MMDRRGLCKLLNCGVVLSLLPRLVSAQQPPITSKPDSQLAGLIGQAVLEAVHRYESNTGKRATTVVIHITGRLPTDSPQDLPLTGSPSEGYIQLNQSHSMFSMKVEINPQKSH